MPALARTNNDSVHPWQSTADVKLSISCPSCKRTLKAPAELAGKRARCPNCQQPVQIPQPQVTALDEFGLMPLETLPASTPAEPVALASLESFHSLVPQENWSTADLATPTLLPPATPQRINYIAPQVTPTAGGRYWLFALALVPLAISLLMPEISREQMQRELEEPTATGEKSTAEGQPAQPTTEVNDPALPAEPRPEGEPLPDLSDLDLDELLELLPDHRLPGAHLSRDSWMHWVYALLSGGLFLGLILLLFQQGEATRGHLLGVGLLTATCGVMSLLMFQWFAAASSVLRFAGIFSVFTLLIRLIGFSYAAAMDPDNGFVLSLLGFTFGVGLCEEFIKALPILSRFRNEYSLDWRGACVWGLASGVGFGVAEGIIYSSDYYNGVAGVDMYAVRFISCVALHAIWTASVGILLWHYQDAVRGEMEWGDWALAILKVQGAVMLLHGLYDTLLKREMTALALLAALASFGFLAWLIRRTLQGEFQPARRVRDAAAVDAQ